MVKVYGGTIVGVYDWRTNQRVNMALTMSETFQQQPVR